jgi:RND superfamily putative drug exporter
MAAVARWCFRHRFVVLLLWLGGVVGVGVINAAVGTGYNDNFTLPGAESSKALDLLRSAFPTQAGESDTIVWRADHSSVSDPAVRDQMTAMLDQVAHAPRVSGVTSPYTREGAAQISADGRTAYAEIHLSGTNQIPAEDARRIIDIGQSARTDGLQVELGGNSIRQANQVSTNATELVGIVAAAVVLLLAFGSLLAMLLPLVTAIVSLVAATMSIGLISNAMSMATLAPTIATLIGLGVGIDYALFVVTRYRNGLQAGLGAEEAAVRALNTSGRAVIFAGLTVCVAMLGLFVVGINFLNGIGVSAAVMVLFNVLAAVTLLPALLGVMKLRVLSRRERRRLATEGPQDVHATGFWARWAGVVSGTRGPSPPVRSL